MPDLGGWRVWQYDQILAAFELDDGILRKNGGVPSALKDWSQWVIDPQVDPTVPVGTDLSLENPLAQSAKWQRYVRHHAHTHAPCCVERNAALCCNIATAAGSTLLAQCTRARARADAMLTRC